jgi:hypothetical protein
VTEKEAIIQLEEANVVPLGKASLTYAKELAQNCLNAGIPAVLALPEGCESGGCSPQFQVMVAEDDLPKISEMMQKEWAQMAIREGSFSPENMEMTEVDPDGEPPCPCCGTAAPLVEGACSDCGLHLA